MKKIGKVSEYNGFYGKIVSDDNENYILLKEEIIGDGKINKLDSVVFVNDEYNKDDIHQKVARFVKKISIK